MLTRFIESIHPSGAFINSTKLSQSNVFNTTFPGKFHLIKQLKKGFKCIYIYISHLEAKKMPKEIPQSKKKQNLPHMSCSWIHIRITYIKLYMCQTNHFLIQHYPNIILCNGSFFFSFESYEKVSWSQSGPIPGTRKGSIQPKRQKAYRRERLETIRRTWPIARNTYFWQMWSK